MVNLKNVSTFLTLLVFYSIHFIKNDQITHFLLLLFSKSFKFLHNLKLKKSWWRFIFAQEREREKKRIPTCHLFSAKQTSSSEKTSRTTLALPSQAAERK